MVILFMLVGFFGGLLLLVVFGIWVVLQASQAQKYRAWQRELAEQPPQSSTPMWTISYKMNNVTREITVAAATEEDALREYLRLGHSPRHVVGTRQQ